MKTLSMIQNTQEWKAYRKDRIGASDANIIMGVSEYMTPLELWKVKTGKVDVDTDDPNFIQAKGHKLEEKIRAMHEVETGYDFPAIVCLSDVYPFLMCSLDGYCDVLQEVLECKYVGQEDFASVKNGMALPQYMPQVMTQLLLTGAKKLRLYVATDDKEAGKGKFKFASVELVPDIHYIATELAPALQAFWGSIVEGKQPPLARGDTLDDSGNKDLAEAVEKYTLAKQTEVTQKALEDSKKKEADAAASAIPAYRDFVTAQTARKKAEKDQEAARKSITGMLRHERVSCNGVKILRMIGKPTVVVDYEAYCKDNNVKIPAKYIRDEPGRETVRITL